MDSENALYPSVPLIREIIKNYLTGVEGVAPSPLKQDPATIALNLGFPSHISHDHVNSFVIWNLREMGLRPCLGRGGNDATYLKDSDGGLYPANNPLIATLIETYFAGADSTKIISREDRKYLPKRQSWMSVAIVGG